MSRCNDAALVELCWLQKMERLYLRTRLMPGWMWFSARSSQRCHLYLILLMLRYSIKKKSIISLRLYLKATYNKNSTRIYLKSNLIHLNSLFLILKSKYLRLTHIHIKSYLQYVSVMSPQCQFNLETF